MDEIKLEEKEEFKESLVLKIFERKVDEESKIEADVYSTTKEAKQFFA